MKSARDHFTTGDPNVHRQITAPEKNVKPLTHQEINRRIGDVAATILTVPAEASGTPADKPLRPHWISAAELVRRMTPFMVHN